MVEAVPVPVPAAPVPQQRSGMFRIPEEESESALESKAKEHEQILKRVRPDEPIPQPKESLVQPFTILPEEEAEAKLPAEKPDMVAAVDTKYMRSPVKFREVLQAEDHIGRVCPDQTLALHMAQSFRPAWRRDGTISAVGGISEKKGTFELNLYKLRVHKSIAGDLDNPTLQEPRPVHAFMKVAYSALFDVLCSACAQQPLFPPEPRPNSKRPNLLCHSIQAQTVPGIWRKFVQVLVDSSDGFADVGPISEAEIKPRLRAEAEIFALLNLLFGDPQVDLSNYLKTKRVLEYAPKKPRKLSEIEINVLRKNLLSNWIQNSLEESVTDPSANPYARLRQAISARDLDSVAKIAASASSAGQPLYGLSGIICSAALAGGKVKELIREQLDEWKRQGSKEAINPEVVKIYEMLLNTSHQNRGSFPLSHPS